MLRAGSTALQKWVIQGQDIPEAEAKNQARLCDMQNWE
jgi:hypothetical protein